MNKYQLLKEKMSLTAGSMQKMLGFSDEDLLALEGDGEKPREIVLEVIETVWFLIESAAHFQMPEKPCLSRRPQVPKDEEEILRALKDGGLVAATKTAFDLFAARVRLDTEIELTAGEDM